MPSTFILTFIFIIVFALLTAFLKGRNKDRCLKDFAHDFITIEKIDGSLIKGEMRLEITGMEMVFSNPVKEKNHQKASYLLYKSEYPNIRFFIRYHSELSEKGKKKREEDIQKIYQPGTIQKLKRQIMNSLKLVRDSLMDILNLFVSMAKKRTPMGAALSSQDKAVTQMKKGVIGTVATAYEPLLETHIGQKVILEITWDDEIKTIQGILKEYTSDFLEILDVDYQGPKDTAPSKADFVVSRQIAVVRFLSI